LVSIKTEEMGERIIGKLNGKEFKDSEIEVREYAHRVPGDQRFQDDDLWMTRHDDRRRQNIKVERQKRIKKDVAKTWFKNQRV